MVFAFPDFALALGTLGAKWSQVNVTVDTVQIKVFKKQMLARKGSAASESDSLQSGCQPAVTNAVTSQRG
jgi:hypothetical protein